MNRAEKRRQEAAARREGVDPHAAQMQMAGAQYNAGRFREAAALCDAILTKSGIHGHALFLGGLCRLRMGDADSAARMLRRAAQLMPDNAQVHAQFASAQIALRDVDGAAKSFAAAIAAKPDFAEAHAHLGMLESWRGDHAAAAARFEEALRLEPSNPGVLLNAANGRLRGGDPQRAAELYQRILAIRADVTEAHFGLGQALREIGDIDGVIENYLEAMRRGPHPNAALSLTLTPHGFSDADFARLQNWFDTAPAGTDARMLTGFALAKVLGDRGRHEEAFAALAEANAIQRGRVSHDAARAHADMVEMRRVFTPAFVAQRSGWGAPCDAPIFIVGMPRSGSTMLEQILAGHSLIAAGGELGDFPAALDKALAGKTAGSLAAQIAMLSQDEARALGEDYLARTAALRGDKPHHTDKLPGNYALIGAIRMALPQARIIHSTRDWADQGFSIFRSLFPLGGHDYAYDLADLAAARRDHDALMAHWISLHGDAIVEAKYESFVADIEGETRRLLDALGLPFEPACLAFHETKRVVRTASAAQVRQPLRASPVGSSKPYLSWLQPMLETRDA